MARRKSYTEVKRTNFVRPEHVKDKAFRGFQCLNINCTEFIVVEGEELDPDFWIECPSCGYVHQAGEVVNVYDYELIDKRDGSLLETGPFQILHDDYIRESQEYKYCIICGTLKPLHFFDRHKPRSTGRQGECKLCKKVYNGIKNQTRLVEQHREASQKRRLYTHFEDRHRLDIKAIYKRFDGCCFKCGVDLSTDLSAGEAAKEGNLDHTLPVYYLWPLTTNNATLLCKNHNGAKAEKWPRDFYNKTELKKLSALTGIDYKKLSGDPEYNPEALKKLQDGNFVEALFEKFAGYPDELLKLRNRIQAATGFDFLSVATNLSPDWVKRADEMKH